MVSNWVSTTEALSTKRQSKATRKGENRQNTRLLAHISIASFIWDVDK